MKKAIIIIATVLAGFVTVAVLISYKSQPDRGVGIDLPFGWQEPVASEFAKGAVCAKGTDPYVMSLPFYVSKHDGVRTCEPGVGNYSALLLDVLIGVSVVGLVGFVVYRMVNKRSE